MEIRFDEKDEKRNTKFTALGMSGVGKTCYIIGMHYLMASGEKGWTLLCSDNATQDKLNRWSKKIDRAELGNDRFPPGTSREARAENYHFELRYLAKPIMGFEWIDYAGGLFEETASDDFSEIEKSISESTALYIFLDGKELCHEQLNKKVRNIRRCANYIQPCITEFLDKHDYIPPVVFVITKYDLCQCYNTPEELHEILKEAFSSLFYDPHAEIYITHVSLGDEISKDEYTGEVDPINIQVPFFIGIHHQLVKTYHSMDELLRKSSGELYRRMVSNMTDVLHQKSSVFEIVKGDKNGGSIRPFDADEWRIY